MSLTTRILRFIHKFFGKSAKNIYTQGSTEWTFDIMFNVDEEEKKLRDYLNSKVIDFDSAVECKQCLTCLRLYRENKDPSHIAAFKKHVVKLRLWGENE